MESAKKHDLALTTLLVAAGTTAPACFAPTQIEVRLTTDVPCADLATTGGAEIFVAGRSADLAGEDPRATAATCLGPAEGGAASLGTLNLVPSDGRDAPLVVQVVLRLPGRAAPSAPPGDVAGCIVARRSIRFIAHASLLLPIVLDSRCAGVSCGADETCERGLCVASAVGDCNGGPCVVGASDGGEGEGGPGVTEAGPLLDASSDAPKDATTPPPDGGLCPALVPYTCADCPGGRCCIVKNSAKPECGPACGTLGNDRVCTDNCQCGTNQLCRSGLGCSGVKFCGGSCDPLE